MTPQQRVIATARAEVGYLEKKSNSKLDDKTANAGQNNYTKYWRDMSPSFQGQPWCDCFVGWCFLKTFGEKIAQELLCGGLFSYYTPTSANHFKAKGQYYKVPRPGDVVYFNVGREIGHTAIVAWVNGEKMGTIEGNTSGASGVIPNGGGVCEKTYTYLNNSYINGFGRPDWTLAEEEDFCMSYEKWKEYQKKYENEVKAEGAAKGFEQDVQAWARETGISDGNQPQAPLKRWQLWAILKKFLELVKQEVNK